VRLVDEQYRLLGRVNVLDLSLLVLFIVGACVVLNAIFGFWSSDQAVRDIEYTLLCQRVIDYDSSVIESGDEVYVLSGGLIGQVQSVEATASLIEAPGIDGQSTAIVSTFESDVRITVRAEGEPDGRGYLVSGTRIQYNGRVEIATSRFQCERAYVLSVTTVE